MSTWTKISTRFFFGFENLFFAVSHFMLILGILVSSFFIFNHPVHSQTIDDTDNDGIPDRIEKRCIERYCDQDSDGIQDYRDGDSDGDGIPDSLEKGASCPTLIECTPEDTDQDGQPNYRQPGDQLTPRTGANELFGIVLFVILGLGGFVIYSETRSKNM